MAELRDRDEIEENLILVLLALFRTQRERLEDLDSEDAVAFWDEHDSELRNLLLYWLGLIFVRSAVQHGAPEQEARLQAATWVLGHTIRVVSEMRRTSQRLLRDGITPDSLDNVFGEERAKRVGITEVSEAASVGSEFAALLLGSSSPEDTWYTSLDERVCPYCGPLHGEQRKDWLTIYQRVILPSHPEFAVYGPPNRTPAHVNCRCFINYASGAGNARSNAA